MFGVWVREMRDGKLTARRFNVDARADWVLSQSLVEAMRGAQRASPLVVHVALLAAMGFSEVSVPRWILILGSVSVVLSSMIALRFRLSVAIPFIGCYLVIGLYFVAIVSPTDPLLGMLFTLTSWAAAVPIMLLGPVAGPVTTGSLALVYSTSFAVVHSSWGMQIPLMFLLVCGLVGVGSALVIRQVRQFARDLDEQEKILVTERSRATGARDRSEATAEYISLLHDTIVNTFGVLARDASASFDPALVRERCARDLQRLQDEQRENPGPGTVVSFRSLEQLGLPVRWKGITGDNLQRYEALLPVDTARGLLGCATEAILNASKHSGAAYVVCDVSYEDDEFVFVISDNGVGFDPETVSERGIANSIRTRAARNGIRAQIDSSLGEGTIIRLACHPSDERRDETHEKNGAQLILAFKTRFATSWAMVVTVVGVISVAMNPAGADVQAGVALAAILGLTAFSWNAYRHETESPRWFVAIVLVVIPLSNLLVFSSESGNGGMFFPSLALTALHTLLLATRRSPNWFFVSVGMQIVTVIGFIVWGALLGRSTVHLVVLLEVPVLALLSILFAFLRLIGITGAHLATSNARASELERQAERLEADRNVRLQWSASALTSPLALLQELADGSQSCASAEIRHRCAIEESFLRQLSTMPSDGGRMSWWFALAIAESRKRSVILLLDAEHAEVPDARDARVFGELMLACIGKVAPDTELRMSLMRQQHSVVLLIVGTAAELLDLTAPETDRGPSVEGRMLAGQVLLETRIDAGSMLERR